jgi:hypothetical protein
MPNLKTLRAFIRFILAFGIALLLMLGGFVALPVNNRDLRVVNQISMQRTRVELIVKDVLILAYRPKVDHAQAISQLQIVLPGWENTQDGLQTGNRNLGIPANLPDEIASAIDMTTPDYLAIKTAAETILRDKDQPVDPIQMDIILQHERDYLLAMSQVGTLYQQNAEARNVQLYWIKIGLNFALLALAVVFWIIVERMLKKQMAAIAPPTGNTTQPLEEEREGNLENR